MRRDGIESGGSNSVAAVREALVTDIPRALHFIHAGVTKIDTLLNGFSRYSRVGENLLAAIRHVLSEQVYVSEKMSTKILDSLSAKKPRGSHSPIEKLTDREFDIFKMVGNGKSTREIAQQLHISPKTVDVHRGHIKQKLELKDAASLILQAVRWVDTQGVKPPAVQGLPPH